MCQSAIILKHTGGLMMKIFIDISSDLYDKVNLCSYTKEDNTIRVCFKDEQDFLNFSANPHISISDFDDYSKNDVSIILPLIDFPTIFSEAIPHFDINSIKDIPINYLKTKKKVYLNILGLSLKDRLELINNPLIHENVLILDRYSSRKYLKSHELSYMYKYLLGIATKIKSQNYSQLETVYCIYTLLKEKIFKDSDDLASSRCLYDILRGDNIVCTGYVNYFLSLCEILSIPAERTNWISTNNEDGHDAVLVYVNDTKYDLIGIYGIDPTWDSKKNKDDESYKNNIENFLLPALMEEKSKSFNKLSISFGCSYFSFFKSYEMYKQFPFIKLNIEIAKKKAKNIYRFLNLEEPSNIDQAFNDLVKLGKKGIDFKTLKDVVTSVTPKSDKELYDTLLTNIYIKKEMMILKRIFGK